MKAVFVFAALLAVAAAYPQSNWQWGHQTQPQQGGANPDQSMQPQSPSKPESPSGEGSDGSGTDSKGHGSWSKNKSGNVLNDVTATVGSAIVAIKGNAIYRIHYASQKNQDQEQRYQPNN